MPRGGHDIPVSGTHLKGTQWLRRVDPTVGHLKGTPWSRRVWTPQELCTKAAELERARREASEAKSSMERLVEECNALREDLQRREAMVSLKGWSNSGAEE